MDNRRPEPDRSGIFITFEGGEGAGKSTQIRRLGAALEAAGRAVRLTREPGGAPGGEAIRSLLVTGDPDRWSPAGELLLVAAARNDHVRTTIRPALEEGAIVLCDRFADSTTAYQGHGHGLDTDMVATVNGLATDGLVPDLTLILDVPLDVGLARARARGGAAAEDRFERMGRAFHERIHAAFRAIAAAEPARCRLIPAQADEETVAARVWDAVRARFPEIDHAAAR